MYVDMTLCHSQILLFPEIIFEDLVCNLFHLQIRYLETYPQYSEIFIFIGSPHIDVP